MKTSLLASAVAAFLILGCSNPELFTQAGRFNERQFRIVNTLVESQEKIVMYFIIDDSSSMADKQLTLANNLKEDLKSLYGRTVELRLYTSTQFGNGFVAPQPSLAPAAKGGAPIGNYAGEFATVNGTVFGFNQKTPGRSLDNYVAANGNSTNGSRAPLLRRQVFFEKGGVVAPYNPGLLFDHDKITETYSPGPSAFKTADGTIQLIPSMSKLEFLEALEKMRLDIIALGDKGSTNGELLGCTLAHLVNQIDLEVKTNPSTGRNRSAFLLLTDEDHAKESTGNYLKCPTGFVSTVKRKPTVKIYPKYYYRIDTIYYDVPKDSGSNLKDKRGYSFVEENCIDSTGTNICGIGRGVGPIACPQEEKEKYYSDSKFNARRNELGGTLPITLTCDRRSFVTTPSYPQNGTLVKGIFVEPGITASTVGFNYKDTLTGPSIFYIGTPGQLFRSKYPTVDLTDDIHPLPYSHDLVSGEFTTFSGVNDITTLKSFIKKSADKSLGNTGYQISLIGNLGVRNPAGCSAKLESASIKLEELTTPGQVLSVCDTNYSKAIDSLRQFALSKTEMSYALDPEFVKAPYFRIDLRGQTLTADTHYKIVGAKIHFFPWNIEGGIAEGDEFKVIRIAPGE